MNKKIILFDIDDTLIDTHPMAKKIYQKLADTVGVTLEEIIETKEKYKLTLEKYSDYEPNKLLDFIYKNFNIDESRRINPFIENSYYQEALFPEARKLLEKLNKNYRLGVFSEGFYDYQWRKVSYLIDLLDKDLIFISRRKLEDNFLEKIPKDSIIIDDRKDVVEKLRDFGRFQVFWLNKKNEEKISGVIEIKELKELESFI